MQIDRFLGFHVLWALVNPFTILARRLLRARRPGLSVYVKLLQDAEAVQAALDVVLARKALSGPTRDETVALRGQNSFRTDFQEQHTGFLRSFFDLDVGPAEDKTLTVTISRSLSTEETQTVEVEMGLHLELEEDEDYRCHVFIDSAFGTPLFWRRSRVIDQPPPPVS